MTFNTAKLKSILCKILLLYPSHNNYQIAVVKLLETVEDEVYIPIAIPYNFEFDFRVGDIGILTYEEAIAGQTHWYDKEKDTYYKHAYTAYYYKYFLPGVITDNEIQKEIYIE